LQWRRLSFRFRSNWRTASVMSPGKFRNDSVQRFVRNQAELTWNPSNCVEFSSNSAGHRFWTQYIRFQSRFDLTWQYFSYSDPIFG
jgi:hypothetical protein